MDELAEFKKDFRVKIEDGAITVYSETKPDFLKCQEYSYNLIYYNSIRLYTPPAFFCIFFFEILFSAFFAYAFLQFENFVLLFFQKNAQVI